VMVAPHEILWRVPFEALPIGERYLGDLTAVTYVPSATAIVRVALDVPAIGEPLSTLAASAPLLSDAVLNRVAQTAPGWTIRKQESAAAEVERVLGALPPELAMSLAGADVTEPALRAMLPKADVIHLALPFRINGAGALFSPLLLAGEPVGNPPEPEQDARLDARDIINMTLNARLVVLSDPAAMSMHDAADETVLVHWAWRAAGVPAVMMPRWKAEPAAGELLAIVHERIRAGDRPDQALHAGRKAVRRTESGAAPYYWAGWLLIAVR
jgi:CHAT domain-containing protein